MRARTALTFSFLSFVGVGSLSALTTYLAFNPKLRKQMREADSPIEAVGLLSGRIRKDAMESADQAMESVRHGWISREVRHAKHMLGRRFLHAKRMARRTARIMKHETKAAQHNMQADAERLQLEAEAQSIGDVV